MNALLAYLTAARTNPDAVEWHKWDIRNSHRSPYANALDNPNKLQKLAADAIHDKDLLMLFLWDTLSEVFGVDRVVLSTYYREGWNALQPKEVAKLRDVLQDIASPKELNLEDYL